MPYHFESYIEDPENHKNYLEGYAAYISGKEIKEMPFEDPKSPEAKAWLNGYNQAIKSEGDAKLKESKKKEEIAMLEKMYKNE